jgi:hypothetical protein
LLHCATEEKFLNRKIMCCVHREQSQQKTDRYEYPNKRVTINSEQESGSTTQ